MKTTAIRPLMKAAAIAALCFSGMAHADPGVAPDLTKGEKPTMLSKRATTILVTHLGPSGILGWLYHEAQDTGKSRQILVDSVMPGSPADGVLQKGDVILGASGSSAKPGPFTDDARKSFAGAIAEAEARKPATLTMTIWREGKTLTPSIALETMGAYSSTAPYDCPKTMRILEKSLAHMDRVDVKMDTFGMNILNLIACNDERFPGNAERMKRAEQWIIKLLPDRANMDLMTSDRVETGSKVAWGRAYGLIVLTEYYLATGNNPQKDGVDLLTAIDAYAQTVTRGQSMFGTMGHQFAMQGTDGSIHGPYAVGYGPVNSAGLAAFVGLNLARECKLPNPKTRAAIEEGLERARRFFSFYVGRGSIPYGEHPPYLSHSSNGKNGMAAIAFSQMPGSEDSAKYFAKMAVAAGTKRDGGHGGAFFAYLWSPLGSAVGGKAAAAAHFKEMRWHLDLSRTWDGGFYYNDYGRSGYNGPTFGKAGFQMSTPALLTYALGLRKISLTGRNLREANELSTAEIKEAAIAGNYAPQQRPVDQLIADLGSFSVIIRLAAATELAGRTESAALRPKLETMAADPAHPSRLGAIKALGQMAKPESASVLLALLDDQQALARDGAVEAFANMPLEVKEKNIDTLLKTAASLRRPPMEVNPQDPVNSTLVVLNGILFGKEIGVLIKGLQPVEAYSTRKQLHEAIRAVATLPSGGQRGNLSHIYQWLNAEDVKAMADTILELIHVEAPADAMFAENIRSASVILLLNHHFIEGVQASVDLFKVGNEWTQLQMLQQWTKFGPSLAGLPQEAQITDLLKQYKGKSTDDAKKALAAMSEQGKPKIPFAPLK